MELYEFIPHPFELPIERKKNVRCKVWKADVSNPSVVMLEYDFGKDLDDVELQIFAEHIVKNHHMSVIAVEYAETEIKFSRDLLSKLESYLPNHLKKISQYLSSRHQELIEKGAFQTVLNDLQFNPFVRYPLNEETVIPLYGNEHTYTDFGVAAALDVLYGIRMLKDVYPNWKWHDCIGVGTGYGAYILQMAEKLVPNTFSMLICYQSLVKPNEFDLFTNATEWQHGNKRNVYTKYIGKFPLYLNEVQGWTTAKDHPFFFEPRHFDLRNLGNSLHLSMGEKQTPLIFIEEATSDKLYLEEKVAYIEKLVNYNYPFELFIADEQDVDNQIVFKKDGKITVDLQKAFEYYLTMGYERNTKKSEDKMVKWFPVNSGVYTLVSSSKYPKLHFIPSLSSDEMDKDIEAHLKEYVEDYDLLSNDLNFHEISFYVKSPMSVIDEVYKALISEKER